ncbi:MAG TPA: oxidoreductase [Burkholderiaceae bacterium]|nr:oxidoreductase [Burkholderiaceae bacterium]
MNDLRVGLIGFGYAGRTFHAPLIRATEGLQLAAVASSDAGKVHAILGPGVDVMTPAALIARDDIDLVIIATPNNLHHPQALAALTAGRHVVVDKPLALSLAQARELAATAQAGGRLLSVFHNRRWDSDFLTLERVLHDGRLGRVVEMVSHFDRYRPQVRARWREGAGAGAGLWTDLGPHLVDQTLRLFGAPSAIALDLAALRDGALSDDWFHAQLRWSQGPDAGPHAGLRVRLHASALAARPGERFTVHGTRGSFSVDGLDVQEEALKAGPGRAAITAPDWGRDLREARLWLGDGDAVRREDLPLRNGAYPAYYASLRDALRGAAPNPVRPAEAIAVQALLEAGLQSARERREIALTDTL